jgi:RND superfamily putative drug exporter
MRRRDRLVLVAWLVVLIAGAFAGAVVFNRLSSATDPAASSESQVARRTIEQVTGERDRIVATVRGSSVSAAPVLVGKLRAVPGVRTVLSSVYGQLPAPAGGGATIAVGLDAGLTDYQFNTAVDVVRAQFGSVPSDQVTVGGSPVIDRDLGLLAKADLARAELVALPIVLILLGFAVRSLMGSVFGLALVATTVTGALLILLALSLVTTVSTFAVNVVTMFGIGLAVDYSLLVINRFRKLRATATSDDNAVATAIGTSGRTVALSGLTVAAALAGLLVFAEPVVRSIAAGGIGAVAIAVTSTLTLLPALLRRFGHRIPPLPAEFRSTAFARLARFVQRHRFSMTAVSLAVLAVLALPLLNLSLQGADVRTLPPSSVARQDADALTQQLPPLASASVTVVAQVAPTDANLPPYIDNLRRTPHVTAVGVRPGLPGALTVIDVATDGPPGGRDALSVVDSIRALNSGFPTAVTGQTARFTDFIHGLLHRAPYAAAAIAIVTFLILLVATGGVLVAAKAVVMNLTSLIASLGALVWCFQQGHLSGLLGFTPTGGISLIIVVLTAAFAFGLSTDYEVFLLSAIVGSRRNGADTNTAVAQGVQHTGRIITTAAALMIVVFIGFATGSVLIITQLGLGLTVAILLDAVIIRLTLTPALMTVFGRLNWIGPRWAQVASNRIWSHADAR